MGLPTVSLAWDFSKINQRRTVASTLATNDAMSYVFFTLWRYLIDTMGWTVKYTCDGTTGPTSSADHTDRLTAQSKCSTRGASTAAAQSFGVATDGGGADHVFAYVGASDDTFLYGVSPGGLYTPAATATNTPTATDQVLNTNALTWVGTSTTADRTFSIIASTDKKHFRLFVYVGGTLQREIFTERVNSQVLASFNWTDPLITGNRTVISFANASAVSGGSKGTFVGGSGASGGQYARIGGTTIALGGGGETYLNTGGSNAFSDPNPELQGGVIVTPLCYASNTAGFGGKVGDTIDAWFTYTTNPWDPTPYGINPNFQFMATNTRMHPWDSLNTLVVS